MGRWRGKLTMTMECVASDHRGVEGTDSDRWRNSPVDTYPEFENPALRVILLPDAKTVHKVLPISTTEQGALRTMLSRLKSRAGSKLKDLVDTLPENLSGSGIPCSRFARGHASRHPVAVAHLGRSARSCLQIDLITTRK